jgi:hypothetical protein
VAEKRIFGALLVRTVDGRDLASQEPGREHRDVLTRDRQNMGNAAASKVYFQVLRYERAVPEDHPAHNGCLLRAEPVAERRVGAAVDAPDPAELLIHGPHARRLDDRRDVLGSQIRIPKY